ncbi:acyloxyacyl hydrolase [Hellea sp.]|nr:acyloxyacyl hydrolase [Hellea sp.]
MTFSYVSLFSASAIAQVAEIRIGIGEFSEDFINPGTEIDNGVEQSLALQGEIIFEEPKFLKWALSPQPYINATLNLEGNTNHAGAGLLWRQHIGKKFYGDFTFGLTAHDGTINIDPDDFITSGTDIDFDDPVSVARARSEFEALFNAFDTQREFGSRILFREQLTLGYRINDEWAAEVFFEHLSNGLLIGRKPDPNNAFDRRDNDSVDTLGMRIAKRF